MASQTKITVPGTPRDRFVMQHVSAHQPIAGAAYDAYHTSRKKFLAAQEAHSTAPNAESTSKLAATRAEWLAAGPKFNEATRMLQKRTTLAVRR